MLKAFNKIAVEQHCMPKKEFVQEHKHLVKVLKSKSHKDDLKEAKRQAKELKEES